MPKTETQKYDRATLDALEEKLADLERFCYQNKMPMFATVMTGDDAYNSHMVSNAMVDVVQGNDKVSECMLIMRGCVPKLPEDPVELEL